MASLLIKRLLPDEGMEYGGVPLFTQQTKQEKGNLHQHGNDVKSH